MQHKEEVLPAQAGVILEQGAGQHYPARAPRTGGGDPRLLLIEFTKTWCSPHRRG